MTIPQALQLALQHLQEGRFADGEALCQQVLAADPEQPDALHLLAIVAQKVGQNQSALDLLHRALVRSAPSADLQNNLGTVLVALGRIPAAISAFQQALLLRCDFAEAHANLGDALRLAGQPAEAAAACHEALRLRPDFAAAHGNLGNALKELGRTSEAIDAYRSALRLRPEDASNHSNLGVVLLEIGDEKAAESAFRMALRWQPGHAGAMYNLGCLFHRLGRLAEAIAAFRATLVITPHDPEVHLNLGVALADTHQIEAAAACYQAALDAAPGLASAHGNLGLALTQMGEFDDASQRLQQAVALCPQDASVHSTAIYCGQFHAGRDPKIAPAERVQWNEAHAAPLRAVRRPHSQDRNPWRCLKIGYVSADLRDHPIAFFLAGLIEAHDRTAFEIHCFASVKRPDVITERMRAAADCWHDVLAADDERLAEEIRRTGMDILVDLSMHSAGNRLLAFARKPATIQISWLAYPGCTGLETIDYRLTDAVMDPPSGDHPTASERPWRLPDAWCCYEPIGSFPEVAPLPALRAGQVTFGALNQFSRFSAGVLRCWMRLLQKVAGARLMLLCPEGRCRERIRAFAEASGVARERLEFISHLPMADYLQTCEHIDICLDPFPCNGLTTTCHALWMGAPVVTLAGASPVARAGASLLKAAGLPELVAHSEDEYVGLASTLAADLPRLAALRSGMRAQMQASPLMDAPRFARNIEAAYQAMWHEWCRTAK